MYKVHCLNNISSEGLDLLTSDYEIVDSPEEADVFLVRSANMHEMEIPESLKAVARAGAGVNNIPLEALAERDIPVFNTPGANANAVKELVLAALLLSARDLIGGIDWVRQNSDDESIGKSAEKAKKAFAGGEISGKALGVIGLGAIGQMVVEAAESLGMSVIGFDPYMDAQSAKSISTSMTFTPNLDELLAASDYITIHVPANDSTRHMIDAEAISKMRDGVAFLNFSRDVLVDDDAMAQALESGKVSRYVTDFANPKVVSMERAIVLPHLGASTAEAEDNCAKMAVQEVMDYLENGEKRHCVNM